MKIEETVLYSYFRMLCGTPAIEITKCKIANPTATIGNIFLNNTLVR
jgi:hypothetical protein